MKAKNKEIVYSRRIRSQMKWYTSEKSNVWFQIVMGKKFQGELRICIDPRELNKALKRKDYTLPVLEAVLHEKGTQAWRLHTTSTGGCPSWTRHSSVKTTHYQCWRLSFMKKVLKREDCTQPAGRRPLWTRHSSVKTTHDQCWRMSFIKQDITKL